MNPALEHRLATIFQDQPGRKFLVPIRDGYFQICFKRGALLTENVICRFTLSQDAKNTHEKNATSTRALLAHNKFDSAPSVLSKKQLTCFGKELVIDTLVSVTYKYRVLTEPMMESIYVYALFPFYTPRRQYPLHQNLHKVTFHSPAVNSETSQTINMAKKENQSNQ